MYLGDFAAASVIDFKFNTAQPDGAPITLAGSPSLACYKDNSTTQSTTGLTLTVGFDSVTGLHNVRVDTSADGSFYAAGSNFQVVIAAGTVDSISVVGYVVGEFSIAARSALRPTTAGRTLDVTASGDAEVDAASVRTAVGLASANLDTQLSTIDDFLDTEVAAIKAKTDNLPSDPADASDIAAAFVTVGNAIAAISIPTANDNADALLDRAAGVETGMTPRQALRIVLAALAGKASGLAPDALTPTFRDVNDTKNRIAAVTDQFGNRTSVTLDAS